MTYTVRVYLIKIIDYSKNRGILIHVSSWVSLIKDYVTTGLIMLLFFRSLPVATVMSR